MKTLSDAEKQTVQKAYKFADLSSYSFKQRVLIRFADLAFFALIKIIGSTIKFEIKGWENLENIERDGKLPIQVFWHEGIFLATYYFRNRKLVVMTSQSFDGEYIARFIQRFGFGVVRGSSTRGGIGALVEQIRLMKLGCPAGFAIDGPKGPPRIVKEGALLLAKKTGNPIVPFTVTPRKFWTLKSWDKMRIPQFFTTAFIEISPPIYVSANADESELRVKSQELQKALDALTENGERWRESL
ncbi:MAG: lysophospholipid acyltransferase family protein [Pyrinomonadaceae bacterium]|nr:lysophospholipid acyltransferase family protein [Pyrinomonadaceae bacterium]